MINKLDDLIKERDEFEIYKIKEKKEFQKSFEIAIEQAYKKKFPRRKFSMDLSYKNNQPEHSEIYETFKKQADKIYDKQIEKGQDIKQQIHDLCEQINEIPKTDEWILIDTIYRSSYRSMGWSELKYSKHAAQQVIDVIDMFGIEAKMEIEEFYINVFAKTTNAGKEVILNKPMRSLKDWMKSCWQNGVNPRVYNPFLPTDLEEKIGIDHFGKDI